MRIIVNSQLPRRGGYRAFRIHGSYRRLGGRGCISLWFGRRRPDNNHIEGELPHSVSGIFDVNDVRDLPMSTLLSISPRYKLI